MEPSSFAARAASFLALLVGFGSVPDAVEASGEACAGWLPGSSAAGLDGTAHAAITWDLDGDGPLLPVLVVGGRITVAANTFVSGVAAWDGTTWRSMGEFAGVQTASGVSPPDIRAFVVYNGELIAAGAFSAADSQIANGIARWDGTAWQPLVPTVIAMSFSCVAPLPNCAQHPSLAPMINFTEFFNSRKADCSAFSSTAKSAGTGAENFSIGISSCANAVADQWSVLKLKIPVADAIE